MLWMDSGDLVVIVVVILCIFVCSVLWLLNMWLIRLILCVLVVLMWWLV